MNQSINSNDQINEESTAKAEINTTDGESITIITSRDSNPFTSFIM